MSRIIDIISIDHNNNRLEGSLQSAILDENFEDLFEYKKVIPPNLLRRMSPVIKKGVGAAMELAQRNSSEKIEGIIVGTGIGCLKDSVKFIDQYKDKNEGLISPTAFIQSTHNTIAGQIGLLLKNHSYNLTYVQNGLTYESAQLDAVLHAEEGNSIILGTSDEKTALLDDFSKLLKLNSNELSEGATFMLLSPDQGKVEMERSECFLFSKEVENLDFLDINENQLVIYGRSDLLDLNLDTSKQIDIRYDKYSGRYFTNTSFGIHLAYDILINGNSLSDKKDFSEIVVINNYQDKKFGKTILRKV